MPAERGKSAPKHGRERGHREQAHAIGQARGARAVARSAAMAEHRKQARERMRVMAQAEVAQHRAPQPGLPSFCAIAAQAQQAAFGPGLEPSLAAIGQISIEHGGDALGELHAGERIGCAHIGLQRRERRVVLGRQGIEQTINAPGQGVGVERRLRGHIGQHLGDGAPQELRGVRLVEIGRDAKALREPGFDPARHRGRRHDDRIGRQIERGTLRRQRLGQRVGERFESVAADDADHDQPEFTGSTAPGSSTIDPCLPCPHRVVPLQPSQPRGGVRPRGGAWPASP